MTIDEAIKHAEEVVKKQENNAKNYPRPDKSVKGSGRKYNAYFKCADEHRQLAEWLKELKQLREQTRWIPANQPPKTNGRYIVTRHFFNDDFVEMASYVTDLHKVDKYDFPKRKAGWYNYDSEYGYYEVDDIVAWMPIEPYKASPTGAERTDKE